MVRVKIEQRRRASRNGSFVTALLRDPIHDVTLLLKRRTSDLVRAAMGNVVACLVAGALFVTAAVFLLVAAVEGLQAAAVPAWLAYLILGVIGTAAGFLFLKKPA